MGAALPFAIWLYLAIEQLPLAAEESNDPRRDLPRGLLLGLATLWIAYSKDWLGLQWLGAAGANGVVLGLVGLSTTDKWPIEPETAAVFAMFLLLTYLISFVYRSHVKGQDVAMFEPMQSLAAFWRKGILDAAACARVRQTNGPWASLRCSAGRAREAPVLSGTPFLAGQTTLLHGPDLAHQAQSVSIGILSRCAATWNTESADV